MDIVLLSLAEDGHVASLFPNYYSLNDKRRYFFFKHKRDNFYRISLTMKSILEAKFIFVLVNGKKRLALLNQLKKKTITEMPAQVLYNKAIWLIKK